MSLLTLEQTGNLGKAVFGVDDPQATMNVHLQDTSKTAKVATKHISHNETHRVLVLSRPSRSKHVRLNRRRYTTANNSIKCI